MKVVVAHNRYSSAVPSGENMVVDAEIEMLRDAGVEVIPFIKSSDSLDSVGAKLKASTGPVWAPATRELARILDDEKPDVLHLHNVYPLISPWAIRTAKARGVAVVQTMHNYRHQCVAGTHLRDGKICEDCTPRGLGLAAVRHGCYRGSRLQSAAMVTGRRVHRSTWQMVDRYFALTPFMAQRLVAMGIDPSRVVERPTSCPDPGLMKPPGKQLLFVGRLDSYKGLEDVLSAWLLSRLRMEDWQLHVVGSGELGGVVAEHAARDESIVWHGRLSPEDVSGRLEACGALALPSRLYEGYPKVLAEALAHGRPVMCARNANLASILDESVGWLVDPTPEAWRTAIDSLAGGELEGRSLSARARYLERLAPTVSRSALLSAYRAGSQTDARADC